jgi:Caulimovirus viroplasmin
MPSRQLLLHLYRWPTRLRHTPRKALRSRARVTTKERATAWKKSLITRRVTPKQEARNQLWTWQQGKPSKIRWYYAVAHRQVPRVYTDWRTAERHVNGYSRAVHKKFWD